ncbi:hypothetical protein DMC63_02275 [Streptomyces sp. WAC 05977]|nr:hypothetical protein DMC63_02275 [Streptomyces sp. WAC 05977]
MVVPPPNNAHGLWAAVRAEIEAVRGSREPAMAWPDTDEDKVQALAVAWRDASLAFAPVRVEPDDIRDAWRDKAGEMFAQRVEGTIRTTTNVRTSCQQLFDHVSRFASLVAQVKESIRATVDDREQPYANMRNEEERRDFVLVVANAVRDLLTAGVASVEGLDSGVTTQNASENPVAEYDAILAFITDEMVRNGQSPELQNIRDLLKDKVNPFTSIADKAEAFKAWYDLVNTGAQWDHKGRILDMTTGDNTFTPLPGLQGQIRYDVWSNIHYGYVGTLGGIDEWTLHAGANAADWKDSHPTDPADQASVQLGIDLAHEYGPGALTPEAVTKAILDRRDRFEQADAIRPL